MNLEIQRILCPQGRGVFGEGKKFAWFPAFAWSPSDARTGAPMYLLLARESAGQLQM